MMQFDNDTPDTDANTEDGTYMPDHWMGRDAKSLTKDEYDAALSLGFDPTDPTFDYEGFVSELNKY